MSTASASSTLSPIKAPSQAPELNRQAIGDRLETMRSELIRCGGELRSLQGLLQGSSFVDDTLRLLDRLACRIGVIGQVKAGKSSLINALMGKPGLLPTDVNPWTTAVTRIHFGLADAPPNVAAEFSFFAPDEWEQLANGSGEIRELTQSLVPGFRVELLQKHVEEMRRRTTLRLGPTLELAPRQEARLFPAVAGGPRALHLCQPSRQRERAERRLLRHHQDR